MQIHILDDWHDNLRQLPSFARLQGHAVTIWHDHVEDVELLAGRLADAEALILFRERTPIRGELLARLPKLRLIAMRGAYPHVDVEACTRNGILFCSNTRPEGASIGTAELTFALILASARQIPQQMASLRAGRWQLSPGQRLMGRTLGLWGYGPIGRQVAAYTRAFGMKLVWWRSAAGRQRAAADGETVAESRAAFFAQSDFVSIHVRHWSNPGRCCVRCKREGRAGWPSTCLTGSGSPTRTIRSASIRK